MKWMPNLILWCVAIVSTVAAVVLWFREVRRLLQSGKSTVESAAGQLRVSRLKAAEENNPESAEVLKRSESIYRQAVEYYNATLQKPWIYLPGRLMGYKKEEEI